MTDLAPDVRKMLPLVDQDRRRGIQNLPWVATSNFIVTLDVEAVSGGDTLFGRLSLTDRLGTLNQHRRKTGESFGGLFQTILEIERLFVLDLVGTLHCQWDRFGR